MSEHKHLLLRVERVTADHVYLRGKLRGSTKDWDELPVVEWARYGFDFPDGIAEGDLLDAVETEHGRRITRALQDQPALQARDFVDVQGEAALERARQLQEREDLGG